MRELLGGPVHLVLLTQHAYDGAVQLHYLPRTDTAGLGSIGGQVPSGPVRVQRAYHRSQIMLY